MYYKVVNRILNTYGGSEEFHSAVVYKYTCSIQYEIGKWIKPGDGSKIFVFNDLELAKKFLNVEQRTFNTCKDLCIFECSVKNPIKVEHVAYVGDNDIRCFWRIWSKFKNKHKKINLDSINYLTNAPQGTFLVSQVKLTKQVF